MLKVIVAEEFDIFQNVLLIHAEGLFIANTVIDNTITIVLEFISIIKL